MAAIHALRLDKMLAHQSRGLGAIMMLHHVRPWVECGFAPNRILEITPDFLDEALTLVRARGFNVIRLDEVPARLRSPDAGRPFVAITLDDGYRDILDHALPVFRKHQTPFTVFATTGFADGTAPLWWLDLENSIRKLDFIRLELDGERFAYPAQDDREKMAAFSQLYRHLRQGPEPRLRKIIAALALEAGVDTLKTTRQLCLDWDGLRQLSKEPLATIGAHTLTHPMLAKHDLAVASEEIEHSRAIIAREISQDIRHFAYPVGDKTSAAGREFELAKTAGFETAVTTRPGMLFPEHADHLHSLPRLSLNGLFQRGRDLDVLLSGVPFALLNRGRRLNVV